MRTIKQNLAKTITVSIIFGVIFALFAPISAFASGLTIYFPTIRVGGEAIEYQGSGTDNASNRMPAELGNIFRPRGEKESTNTIVAESSTGNNSSNGGEINTGNATTTVNVEDNNASSNDSSQSNNNGGVSTGAGGDGGRGVRGGDVETGIINSDSRTFNNLNEAILQLLPWLR